MTGIPVMEKPAAFPEPYLQPDRNKDCGFYSAAYIARCLGHAEATAEQVKAWRADTRCHESYYSRNALGADTRTCWDVYRDSPERKTFWLGSHTGAWVREWLADGWIAHVNLHRIETTGHAVVLLEARDEGVLLMDPIYGHIVEPWGWFLGPGPKDGDGWPGSAPDGRAFYGCHVIDCWYRPAQAVPS